MKFIRNHSYFLPFSIVLCDCFTEILGEFVVISIVCLLLNFSVLLSFSIMPELTEVERAAAVSEPVAAGASGDADGSGTDSDSDVSAPELEDAGAGSGINFPGGAAAAAAAGLPIDISKAKQTRGEKKARKIMSKLGLKPVSSFCTHSSFLDSLSRN